MTAIASPQNPRIKALRRLHDKRERARSGRFLAEGEDLVAAAAQAGRPALEGYRVAGTELGGPAFADVERDTLAAVSSLGSGTRVIGVYEQRWVSARGPLCVYLHGVADPGNVGTILRAAQAFAASCVVLGPGCADPHSPKAVRAGMGAIFAVEIARVADVSELPGRHVALVPDAPQTLGGEAGAAARGGVTLLVGAERDGLPRDVVAACDARASIPIASHSLNAAMAATVALYEMTREPSRVPAS